MLTLFFLVTPCSFNKTMSALTTLSTFSRESFLDLRPLILLCNKVRWASFFAPLLPPLLNFLCFRTLLFFLTGIGCNTAGGDSLEQLVSMLLLEAGPLLGADWAPEEDMVPGGWTDSSLRLKVQPGSWLKNDSVLLVY